MHSVEFTVTGNRDCGKPRDGMPGMTGYARVCPGMPGYAYSGVLGRTRAAVAERGRNELLRQSVVRAGGRVQFRLVGLLLHGERGVKRRPVLVQGDALKGLLRVWSWPSL